MFRVCFVRSSAFLPLSSFKADLPTAYRKFLRISDIRELWAATRILSRGSMSSSSSWYVRRFFSNLKPLLSNLSFQSDSLVRQMVDS